MSIEEKIDQAKGAAKEGVGKLTGDKKIEKEGAAEKAAAKVKEVAEDVKDAIEGTIDGVKNIINKDKIKIKNNFDPFFCMDDDKCFIFYHSRHHCKEEIATNSRLSKLSKSNS